MEKMPNTPQRRTAEQIVQKALAGSKLARLPEKERDILIKESAETLLETLRGCGATEFNNISEMYDALRGETLIVRREDPTRVIDAMADDVPISIQFPKNERYSNAALWRPSNGPKGLDNSFLEGYGHLNTVVTVIGFHPNAELDVQELPDAARTFAGIDRTTVRSIKGDVKRPDIVFITVRTPAFAFPEEEMTESELERYDTYKDARTRSLAPPPVFIHRGFLFTQHLAKQ